MWMCVSCFFNAGQFRRESRCVSSIIPSSFVNAHSPSAVTICTYAGFYASHKQESVLKQTMFTSEFRQPVYQSMYYHIPGVAKCPSVAK
jgi:hypothetical protein